ncbi:MAG: site-specific integrase [Calditrichaeota bacterium]|nr:site-specific integrase [Calditrichota bacterium]MCB0289258.1 site-specific integrase [Calditrichota bacterium]MCB0296341.1 site-specific integrase [Calditrichota bacterium]MCB0302152.1 site-specific integrase [Calditrichota bacterium]MCB9090524.1 site-specific integrase [Calditrichia bacterium]
MAFLEKRKNSKGETIWVIHYRIGKKQKMKTIGKTDKRTAQKILVQFEIDLAKRAFGIKEIKKITLKKYQEEYFKFAVVEKSERTVERERQIYAKFLQYFGDINLSDIQVRDLEEYRSYRLKTVREETINLEFRHLKAIFNKSKDYGYLQVNPFVAIKPIRVPESDLPRFFELEEIAKVRKAFIGDPFQDIVEFYLLTGARLKEPLSLTWDDIDFRRKQLRIKSTNTKAKKHRIISFGDDLQLEQLLKRIPRRKDQLLFGPKDNKEQWDSLWVSKRISKILTKIGFPWATCHTFRHTYISHLVMQGVPLITVKELVGHADIKTTLRYAHIASAHTKAMSGKRPY